MDVILLPSHCTSWEGPLAPLKAPTSGTIKQTIPSTQSAQFTSSNWTRGADFGFKRVNSHQSLHIPPPFLPHTHSLIFPTGPDEKFQRSVYCRTCGSDKQLVPPSGKPERSGTQSQSRGTGSSPSPHCPLHARVIVFCSENVLYLKGFKMFFQVFTNDDDFRWVDHILFWETTDSLLSVTL